MAREGLMTRRAVVAAAILRGDTVCLIRSRTHGLATPGGKREAGETQDRTLEREIFQETGLVVTRVGRLLGTRKMDGYVVYVYAADAIGELAPGDDAVEATWASPDALRDSRNPGDVQWIEDALRERRAEVTRMNDRPEVYTEHARRERLESALHLPAVRAFVHWLTEERGVALVDAVTERELSDTVESLVLAYAGVNADALEQERRAMLDALAAPQFVTPDPNPPAPDYAVCWTATLKDGHTAQIHTWLTENEVVALHRASGLRIEKSVPLSADPRRGGDGVVVGAVAEYLAASRNTSVVALVKSK